MELKRLVGDRIRQARLDKRLTQHGAADLVGITQNVWSAYELGKVNIPLDTLDRIVRVLEKPIGYFVIEDYEYTVKAPVPKDGAREPRAKKKRAA